MKKYLSILLTIILLCVSGCAKKVERYGVSDDAKTTVKSGDSKTAKWPTKTWSKSSPKEQGLDEEILIKADQRINDNYTNIYSLLVVRHGYLVYEKYYHDMHENDVNPVYSVTKSVMSSLTGIALREKFIDNIDQKVCYYLPRYFKKVDNEKKKNITIKNVLTMTGGLESVDPSWMSFYTSKDWLEYTIKMPIISNPGEKFEYNTGLTGFLSGIITKTSKMKTKDFADQYLFNQIGISVDKWEADKKGVNAGGFGLSMKPVDMAKFGYLYLHNGLWDGKQIIPKEWVEASTQKQVSVSGNKNYGFLFWTDVVQDKAHNKQYNIYYAAGAGGQFITVIPDLDMVVVITACEWETSKDKSSNMDVIKNYIAQAVK